MIPLPKGQIRGAVYPCEECGLAIRLRPDQQEWVHVPPVRDRLGNEGHVARLRQQDTASRPELHQKWREQAEMALRPTTVVHTRSLLPMIRAQAARVLWLLDEIEEEETDGRG